MRFTNRVRLHGVFLLGAAALLSACTMHFRSGTTFTDDAFLQRMLVAEDARGTGPEGINPLLEGIKSSDTLLRRVAERGLARLKWAPTPPAPAPPPVANRAARPPARRAPTGPCARLIAPAQSADLR